MNTTLYDIARKFPVTDPTTGKAMKGGPAIADGLKPEDPPLVEGLHLLTPAQVAGLGINLFSPSHWDGGYQRDPSQREKRIRKMIAAMAEGKAFPPILYAVNGATRVIDGGGRGLASIATRSDIWAAAIYMDDATQRQIFADQGQGTTVDSSHRTVISDGPVARYVVRACQSRAGDHPWSQLVTSYNASIYSVGASQAQDLILGYITGRAPSGDLVKRIPAAVVRDDWDPVKADELGELLRAFGTKKSNPAAFGSISLRAITSVAHRVVAQSQHKRDNVTRWKRDMPKFKFQDYSHIRTARVLEMLLVEHWNKRLVNPDRKI